MCLLSHLSQIITTIHDGDEIDDPTGIAIDEISQKVYKAERFIVQEY